MGRMKGFVSAKSAGKKNEEDGGEAPAPGTATSSAPQPAAAAPAAAPKPAEPTAAAPKGADRSDSDGSSDSDGGPETRGKMIQRHKKVRNWDTLSSTMHALCRAPQCCSTAVAYDVLFPPAAFSYIHLVLQEMTAHKKAMQKLGKSKKVGPSACTHEPPSLPTLARRRHACPCLTDMGVMVCRMRWPS